MVPGMHACHPSYSENINRRIEVQTYLGKNRRHYLKINASKKIWVCG
jgi:hypothetical protein